MLALMVITVSGIEIRLLLDWKIIIQIFKEKTKSLNL